MTRRTLITCDPTDPALIARVEDLRRAYEADAASGFALALGLERHPYTEVAADLRALLARVRELEAKLDAARAALREMLEHSGVTDVGDEDKFPEDIAAESKARRALASAPAEGGR